MLRLVAGDLVRNSAITCAILLAVVLSAGCSLGQHSSAGLRENGWLTYGHDFGNRRFSSLSEIGAGNVSRLTPAYVFQTGVLGSFETSPIVADGAMYLTTAYDGVFAIDAKTGDLLWKRDPLKGKFRQCCGPVNRGAAITPKLLLVGQLDGTVVALDRKYGSVVWRSRVADNAKGYSITMAPLVYRDTVIVGVGGGDLGIRGALIALSIRDGRVKWRWYATDARHWFGRSPRLRTDTGYLEGATAARARSKFATSWMRGGGGIWTTPAIDPTRNAIYLTTGNPWPDLDGETRPGDNLYTDSIVALNASSGKKLWYFQEVPHDTMDLDAASPPVLFQTVNAHGERVDAIGEIGKTGLFYVLDRDNGKLIRGSTDVSSVKLPHDARRDWTGGASWSPMSFDPTVGLVIVTATRHLAAAPGKHRRGLGELEAEWRVIYSTVSAVNVATGAIVWQDEFDGGLVGGTVSTAGGLTFVGEGNGYFDALETRTGVRLWRFQTGAGVNAPPIVFATSGREYVAVASGGNQQLGTPRGDALFVFQVSP